MHAGLVNYIWGLEIDLQGLEVWQTRAKYTAKIWRGPYRIAVTSFWPDTSSALGFQRIFPQNLLIVD